MSRYRDGKEQVRNAAIEWQLEHDGKCLSWNEIATQQDKFCKLAKRYGLVREFRENGII